MELDVPVWTIRPNWAQGVLERLEWLTSVLISDTGVEQRISRRLSPRRSFEITVNPTRGERTYLDLLLHSLGSEEWLFPLWHDQAALGSAIGAGVDTLEIDNTFREFTSGGYAILYASAFEWEVVGIADQTERSLELVAGVEKQWPRGTKVYPLRRCTIQADTALSALTSRVGQSVLLFQVNEANEYPAGFGDAMGLYEGSPIITVPPNRSQEITLSHTRMQDEVDGETGLRYVRDTAGRAFGSQSHNWMLQGREAQAAFRSFLYALRGRQKMVWLPSFNDDLLLTEPVDSGDTAVTIESIGIGYVSGGAPIAGRSRFWTGKEVALHSSISAPPSDEEERLVLRAPTTAGYAPGASWSFLEPARLDADMIELRHHTDSDGVMECATAFRTFANDRDASGSNFLEPPEAVKSREPCGAPFGLNPCTVIFPGWYVRVFTGIEGPTPPTSAGYMNLSWPSTQPNPPRGKTINTMSSVQDGSKITENINPNYPILQGQTLVEARGAHYARTTTFYFPVNSGTWTLQHQYSAYTVPGGSVYYVRMQPWDGAAVEVWRQRIGGIIPFFWESWNW